MNFWQQKFLSAMLLASSLVGPQQTGAQELKKNTPHKISHHEPRKSKPPIEQKWFLYVQSDKKKPDSKGLVEGTLILRGFGKTHSFRMVSGGWGEYGKKSHLPGLSEDLTPNDDANRATYKIYHDDYFAAFDAPWLDVGMKHKMIEQKNPKTKKPEKLHVGFFIGLYPQQDIKGRNGLGIHPDAAQRGTLGCIGIDLKDAKRFEDIWRAIPKNRRPETLYVVEPNFIDLTPKKPPPKPKPHRPVAPKQHTKPVSKGKPIAEPYRGKMNKKAPDSEHSKGR